MIIKSQLQHNNKQTGLGKFYVAKITGRDPKYGLKREFLKRETEYSNSSSTTWSSYIVNISEDGIYEVAESNNYKNEKYYIEVINEESVKITLQDVMEKF